MSNRLENNWNLLHLLYNNKQLLLLLNKQFSFSHLKGKSIMKRIVLIITIASVFTACGNSSESSIDADTTVNSITPPPTSDTTSTVAPMMGDTSKTEADSLKK